MVEIVISEMKDYLQGMHHYVVEMHETAVKIKM